MRAMYDLEASDGIRGPSWQEFHAVYSQTAVCGAFWIHRARILPKPSHFGCIVAIFCHEGALFLSEAPLGMHQVKILPRLDDGESFRRISCHCRPAENASRGNLATFRHLGTHFANILPLPVSGERITGKSCHCRSAENSSRGRSCHCRSVENASQRNYPIAEHFEMCLSGIQRQPSRPLRFSLVK